MSASAVHDSPYAWGRLALTLACACVGSVGMWAIIALLPDVEAEFGTDRGTVSAAYTVCMVGFAAGSLMIGRWVDRYGITPVLIGSAVVLAAGFAASAVSPTIWGVIVTHLLIGFGAAAFFGPLIADISHWFLARRGIAVAITASGNYLAGAIWPHVLTGVTEASGWRGAYLVLAVVVPLIVVPLSFVLRRQVPDEAAAIADSAASLRRRATGLSPRALQVFLMIAGVACCMAMAMPQVHIVALCVDMGFGPTVGAEMLSLMLLGGVTSRLISGMIADRLGGVLTLLIGSVMQCIALFLYLPANGMTSLYIVSLIFGLSQGGIVPAYSIIVREYMPSREAGARVGYVTFATIVGMAGGGWVSGLIYDWTGSYDLAFINGIAWNALNIAIVGMILWTTTRRVAPA
ncbi:MAG: MFS transporter [Pseudomonadota bacterium]